MTHLLTTLLLCIATAANRLVIAGKNGPGKGKHIVLVSADEEYPSEQALPQLARILSQRHGFDCSVLFAIDAATGAINPNQNDNIPGLEALDSADPVHEIPQPARRSDEARCRLRGIGTAGGCAAHQHAHLRFENEYDV